MTFNLFYTVNTQNTIVFLKLFSEKKAGKYLFFKIHITLAYHKYDIYSNRLLYFTIEVIKRIFIYNFTFKNLLSGLKIQPYF